MRLLSLSLCALLLAANPLSAAEKLAKGTPDLRGDATPMAGLETEIRGLYDGWATAHYATKDDGERAAQLETLTARAQRLVKSYPNKAEPLIWEAILESTQAEDAGSRTALRLAEHARDLLLKAEQINPGALQGSIYTTLGALYFKVPGWPIGFGDSAKAEAYLKKALTYNPNGLESNYYYGQFLFTKDRYAESIAALEKAAAAPMGQVAGKPTLGEEGRHREVDTLLAQVRAKSRSGMKR